MKKSPRIHVALGLGANRDHPFTQMQAALEQLRIHGATDLQVSDLYESTPVNCVPGTPPFLNAAATCQWPGSADELLIACQHIERALGRPAEHTSHEARVIDLDILLFGDTILNQPNLIIPHPRLTERLFVLMPLADVAPDWSIPGASITVQAALQRVLTADPQAATAARRLGPWRQRGRTLI